MQLRPFQKDTVLKIKAKLDAGVTRQIVHHATGLGKTCVLASLPDELGFAGRMLVVVHREELNTQALAKLKAWNPTRWRWVAAALAGSKSSLLAMPR
jgi:superfamily II DNA or RNA helicase